MKATIERATLLKSLSHVQSVVERRNTIPILSNVLIEAASDGGIRLMATDLALQFVETVQAAVDTPGATTVSANPLFDIVRQLPEGSQVSLSAGEGKMEVTIGRAACRDRECKDVEMSLVVVMRQENKKIKNIHRVNHK